MNRLVLALAVTGTLAVTAPLGTTAHAADVAVSVSIGEPGFYGRLDIGGFPQPRLIYAQPVIVTPAPPGRPPIYLRVPPGHAKHWSKHCHAYDACGERVYFVKDDWYTREYAPRYARRSEPGHAPQHPPSRDDWNGERGGNPPGHGKGQGKGRKD